MLFINIGTPEIIMIVMAMGFPLILTVFCIIDIMRSNFRDQTNKLLWIIIVLLAPIIGPLLYLVWGRNQKASTEVQI
jgi:hypothetical protein